MSLVFKLSEQNVNNICVLLRDAEIKGSDSFKVVKIVDVLTVKKDDGLYELSEDLAAFILNTLNDIRVQGKFAASIVSIQLALAKPVDPKVDQKSEKPIPQAGVKKVSPPPPPKKS